MNPVTYFEIPVENMPRAVAFYESVFSIHFELTSIDGNEMALFPYEDDAHGASGALAKGYSYAPGKSGPRIYFRVQDIDATLSKVVAIGSEVIYPITEIPGWGWVAEFGDTEGNCIAVHCLSRGTTDVI